METRRKFLQESPLPRTLAVRFTVNPPEPIFLIEQRTNQPLFLLFTVLCSTLVFTSCQPRSQALPALPPLSPLNRAWVVRLADLGFFLMTWYGSAVLVLCFEAWFDIISSTFSSLDSLSFIVRFSSASFLQPGLLSLALDPPLSCSASVNATSTPLWHHWAPPFKIAKFSRLDGLTKDLYPWGQVHMSPPYG